LTDRKRGRYSLVRQAGILGSTLLCLYFLPISILTLWPPLLNGFPNHVDLPPVISVPYGTGGIGPLAFTPPARRALVSAAANAFSVSLAPGSSITNAPDIPTGVDTPPVCTDHPGRVPSVFNTSMANASVSPSGLMSLMGSSMFRHPSSALRISVCCRSVMCRSAILSRSLRISDWRRRLPCLSFSASSFNCSPFLRAISASRRA
jgi:hypothetical protein